MKLNRFVAAVVAEVEGPVGVMGMFSLFPRLERFAVNMFIILFGVLANVRRRLVFPFESEEVTSRRIVRGVRELRGVAAVELFPLDVGALLLREYLGPRLVGVGGPGFWYVVCPLSFFFGNSSSRSLLTTGRPFLISSSLGRRGFMVCVSPG
uniref:Uncharacterized protein n=1 Tax=Cacopsylla melanoneura TaxID=428564 RepID=A0A8D9E3R7_9HEMI